MNKKGGGLSSLWGIIIYDGGRFKKKSYKIHFSSYFIFPWQTRQTNDQRIYISKNKNFKRIFNGVNDDLKMKLLG